MPLILLILIMATLTGCLNYQGSEMWRRSMCEDIVDVDERTRCLEEATRPESEYKRDVEEASDES